MANTRPILGKVLPLQVLGALTAVGAGATRPLMALVFGGLANQFNTLQDAEAWKTQINQQVLFLVYLFIGQWVLVLSYGILFSVSAMHSSIYLRASYFRSAIRREVGSQGLGNTATDFSTNTERIEDALAEKLGLVIEASSTIIVSWVIALTRSWRLTLVLTVVTAILLGSNFGTAALDARLEGRIQAFDARAAMLAEECFEGITAVISTSSQDKILAKFHAFTQAAKIQRIRKSPVLAAQYSVSYFMVLSSYALAFWYGFRLLEDSQVSNIGTILIVILSINLGTNAMRRILPIYGVLAKAKASLKSVRSVINEQAIIDPFSSTGFIPEAVEGKIEFRGVTFAYPLRPEEAVVKTLDLTFEAGQVTALVGPSGSGKSTIAAMIGRWYEPGKGSITLDGQDLKDLNVRAYRSNVRFVQQDTVLFNDSINSNVANGLHGTSLQGLENEQKRELVKKSCIIANAHGFIEQLPASYDTTLGEAGNFLSGGQRQRIAIARAIVSSPKILVLDEATSALDIQSEAAVEFSIQQASNGKTTILVTHKLSLAQKAHKIYVLDKGRVVQRGNHDSLVKADGAYKRMYEQQNSFSRLAADQAHILVEEDNMGKDDPVEERTNTSDQGTASVIEKVHEGRETHWPGVVYALLTEDRRAGSLLAASLMAGIVGAFVYPGQAITFGESITAFQLNANELQGRIDFWSLIWFLIAIGAFFVYMAVGILTALADAFTLSNYKSNYFDAMLHQPLSYYMDILQSPGSLTDLLSSHPSQVQSAVAVLSTLVITIFNIGSSSILSLALAWKLALVTIFGSLPVIVLAGFLRLKAEGNGKRGLSHSLLGSARYASEAVSASRTVASLTMETAVCEELNRKLREALPVFYKSILVTMPLFAFAQAGNLLGMALAFWYGGDLLVDGETGALQIWTIFLAIVSGGEAAADFFATSNNMSRARFAWNSIKELQSESQKFKDSLKPKEKCPTIDRVTSLSLEGVSFRYPRCKDDSNVLTGLSLSFSTGKRYAIVGSSGSGKSTILMLLANFYSPTQGAIKLNDIPLNLLDSSMFRKHVALVNQDTVLFSGTLAENILLGVPGDPADHAALLETAARQASIHAFATSLPDGYATECGARGTSFSGGQRQRIALARALAQRPQVLLLDEPTSALDGESEAAVLDSLRENAEGRITVTVTHRLSTARGADEIVVLGSGGRVLEVGVHAELLAQRGVYWAMWREQSVERQGA